MMQIDALFPSPRPSPQGRGGSIRQRKGLKSCVTVSVRLKALPLLRACRYPHRLAHRFSFAFRPSFKSRRDGLFIDRQPLTPRFFLFFSGAARNVPVNLGLLAAPLKNKKNYEKRGLAVYKQAIPTGLKSKASLVSAPKLCVMLSLGERAVVRGTATFEPNWHGRDL